MKTSFFMKYEPLTGEVQGLMFLARIEVQFPTELAKYDDPIRLVTEDERGNLKVVTEKCVYLQDGYQESK